MSLLIQQQSMMVAPSCLSPVGEGGQTQEEQRPKRLLRMLQIEELTGLYLMPGTIQIGTTVGGCPRSATTNWSLLILATGPPSNHDDYPGPGELLLRIKPTCTADISETTNSDQKRNFLICDKQKAQTNLKGPDNLKEISIGEPVC
mmetsp:Transcript_27647/g.75360  ORF Transcript_27647/g.75360 Transcript_27647/m.75360 type:complete len:146 (-) Transcript_27647:459-896(-)